MHIINAKCNVNHIYIPYMMIIVKNLCLCHNLLSHYWSFPTLSQTHTLIFLQLALQMCLLVGPMRGSRTRTRWTNPCLEYIPPVKPPWIKPPMDKNSKDNVSLESNPPTRTISPWTISPWTISPWTISPWTISPWTIFPHMASKYKQHNWPSKSIFYF